MQSAVNETIDTAGSVLYQSIDSARAVHLKHQPGSICGGEALLSGRGTASSWLHDYASARAFDLSNQFMSHEAINSLDEWRTAEIKLIPAKINHHSSSIESSKQLKTTMEKDMQYIHLVLTVTSRKWEKGLYSLSRKK